MSPDLQPFEHSHDAGQLEAQLKAMTEDLFREYLRYYEREINAYGMPHLADLELIERWVKADGLSMVRDHSEDAMRYLFRAWRSRNPKRGLHFLRTYLQLLWPGGWSADQLWQKKGAPYPTALVASGDPEAERDMRKGHYLTSRINVDVHHEKEDGTGVLSMGRALRASLGAKFVLVLRLLRTINSNFLIANTGQAATITQAEGEPIPGVTPEPMEAGFYGYADSILVTHAVSVL